MHMHTCILTVCLTIVVNPQLLSSVMNAFSDCYVMLIVAIQMGRPSKHRLQSQLTASLRQRDMKLLKLAEDADENGWHGQTVSPPPTTTTTYLPSGVSPARLLADGLLKQDDGLMMRGDGEMMLMQQRSRSFGSDGGAADADLPNISSEGDSDFLEVSPQRTHHDHLRNIDSATMKYYVGISPVSVKTECTDGVGLTSLSSSSLLVSEADKLFSAGWQGGNQQQVLSGGYCREVDSNAAAVMPTVPFVGNSFCSSPPYVANAGISSAAETAPGGNCDPMAVDEISDHMPTSADTVGVAPTVESPDDGVSAAVSASRLSRSTTDVTRAVDVSPGSKWHIASDRDSPYVSVMALASSCQLFSESCPSKSASNDDSSMMYDPASSRYWLEPELPDENVIFTEKHCEMINQITAAYDRYVQTGTIINETLVSEMKVKFTNVGLAINRLWVQILLGAEAA